MYCDYTSHTHIFDQRKEAEQNSPIQCHSFVPCVDVNEEEHNSLPPQAVGYKKQVRIEGHDEL